VNAVYGRNGGALAWKRLATPVIAATLLLGGVYAAALPDPAPAESLASGVAGQTEKNWVGTWAASPSGTVTRSGFRDYTFRNVLHTSLGGSRARVRLSNTFSGSPVEVRATLGLPRTAGSADAATGTLRRLTFGGRAFVVIPPRSQVLSDPVDLAIPADSDVFVSTYTPRSSGPVTSHRAAHQTSFFTIGGDHSADVTGFAFRRRTTSWHYVTGLDVDAAGDARAVVALGDSITDGAGSGRDRNARWPDVLADRLAHRPIGAPMAVLNAGINGNRVLLDSPASGPRSLARLDRDVFAAPGVRTVVVLEGVNDLKQQPRVDNTRQLIAGLEQIARQARTRGIRVVCGTITPYRGWPAYDALGERIRQKVNAFIRTGAAFDAIVDFDLVVRDPERPARLAAAYDSGDHLHPNAAGLRAMAEAIDLTVL
jgi:lysophospholipase L1-like esterase